MSAKPIPRIDSKTLKGEIRREASPESRIITDELASYRRLEGDFAGGHEIVKDNAREYVRGDVYTNTAESWFALTKRGHYGVFHQVSKKHLSKYVDEFAFRWNFRKVTDAERRDMAIQSANGKRLLYRESSPTVGGVQPWPTIA